ncbi:hypothetical protein [Mesorhizobium caraganae]|uniref:hypothetical protein n=1 Tax=Mesorhizobium caraganae TaxID=483206 RepID=UPI00177CB10B|nr:hypothetical protein [Mesorhizobium caraganae]
MSRMNIISDFHVLCNANAIKSAAAFRNLRDSIFVELIRDQFSGTAQPDLCKTLSSFGIDQSILTHRVTFHKALTPSKHLQSADVAEPDEQRAVTNMRRKIPHAGGASRSRDSGHSVRSCVVATVYSRCPVAGPSSKPGGRHAHPIRRQPACPFLSDPRWRAFSMRVSRCCRKGTSWAAIQITKQTQPSGSGAGSAQSAGSSSMPGIAPPMVFVGGTPAASLKPSEKGTTALLHLNRGNTLWSSLQLKIS